MSNELPLKRFIVASMIIHGIFIYPWSFTKIHLQHEILFKKIELTYFKNDLSNPIVKEQNPITSLNQTDAKPADQANPRKLKIDLSGLAINTDDKDLNSGASEEGQKKSKKIAGIETGNIHMKKTQEDYFLTVREKIKEILEKNKNKFQREGDVYVQFKIGSDGLLTDLSLAKNGDSASGSLEKIALESVRNASPFPPFKKEISDKELFFKLPIRFTLNSGRH